MDIHADLAYDVTSYFRSASNWISILVRTAKIVPQVVSYKQLSSEMAN